MSECLITAQQAWNIGVFIIWVFAAIGLATVIAVIVEVVRG